jgi:hypothetical protein
VPQAARPSARLRAIACRSRGTGTACVYSSAASGSRAPARSNPQRGPRAQRAIQALFSSPWQSMIAA